MALKRLGDHLWEDVWRLNQQHSSSFLMTAGENVGIYPLAGHLKTEKVMIGKTKVRWPQLRHRECMVFPWIKVFLGGENCICPTLNNRHTPRDTQPSVGWGWYRAPMWLIPPPPPSCRTWVVILIDGHWGRLKVSHFEPLLKSEDQDLLLLVWNLDRDGQRSLHCCKLYLHF